MVSRCSFRVYYEDTDAGGVIYYANYLKFAERARTETLREVGLNQSGLITSHGIMFVVRKAEMELLRPGKLDDLLEIHSTIESMSGASMAFMQEISTNGVMLATVRTLVVCVNKDMRPVRVPAFVREKL